jgi:hypothetical protein
MGRAYRRDGGEGNAYRILWESQKEREHWEYLEGGGLLLKWILERDTMGWYGLS